LPLSLSGVLFCSVNHAPNLHTHIGLLDLDKT
jgi:hypothetical protein